MTAQLFSSRFPVGKKSVYHNTGILLICTRAILIKMFGKPTRRDRKAIWVIVIKNVANLAAEQLFSRKHHKGKRFLGLIPACDSDNHETINAIIQYLQLPT